MKFKKDDAIRIKHQPEKLWLVSDPYCPTDMTRVRNGSADNTPPEKVGYYVEIQDVNGQTAKYHEDSLEHYGKRPNASNTHRSDRVPAPTKTETNKFKRAWILLWYNDITRFSILLGIPVIPILIFCYLLFGSGEYLRSVAMISYIAFFIWAMIDNDYSNLRKIGLDEYRNKL